MTFLELCQMAARESGTVAGTVPTGVTSQSGRLEKVVNWVNDAWREIQTSRNRWLWMRGEFGSPDAVTIAGTNRYTPASWNLTRLAEWIIDQDTVTIYKQSEGVSDESQLVFMPWQDYRRQYERGTQVQNRPLHFSISPANEFCVGPVPDDVYVIRGEFQKTPQDLTANGDIPELPARFHAVIAWHAVLLLNEHDEAQLPIATASRHQRQLMDDLRRDQLPKMHIGSGPLA